MELKIQQINPTIQGGKEKYNVELTTQLTKQELAYILIASHNQEFKVALIAEDKREVS